RISALRLRQTKYPVGSTQAFQLLDHPLDDPQPALPERRITRVEAEGGEKLGMRLGAAGREHRQITLGKALGGALVDCVEGIHQAIAEGISVDVERRVDEMRDIGPQRLVARLELDRRTEALALHVEPQLAD